MEFVCFVTENYDPATNYSKEVSLRVEAKITKINTINYIILLLNSNN